MDTSIEAEMARFEEQISAGSKLPAPSPPPMPPPMFLPHSLQQNKPSMRTDCSLLDKEGHNNASPKQDTSPEVEEVGDEDKQPASHAGSISDNMEMPGTALTNNLRSARGGHDGNTAEEKTQALPGMTSDNLGFISRDASSGMQPTLPGPDMMPGVACAGMGSGPRMEQQGPQMGSRFFGPGPRMGSGMMQGGPQIGPGGSMMRPGMGQGGPGLGMRPGGPGMGPMGPGIRMGPGGPGMGPGGPGMGPGGPGMGPGGPGMGPGGPGMGPGGATPRMGPGGLGMGPGGPGVGQGGHGMRPGGQGPGMGPRGPGMGPGGPGPGMGPGGPGPGMGSGGPSPGMGPGGPGPGMGPGGPGPGMGPGCPGPGMGFGGSGMQSRGIGPMFPNGPAIGPQQPSFNGLSGMNQSMNQPPPMPGFFPPPVMPDFSDLLKGPAVYSSAPVLKNKPVKTESSTPKDKSTVSKDEKKNDAFEKGKPEVKKSSKSETQDEGTKSNVKDNAVEKVHAKLSNSTAAKVPVINNVVPTPAPMAQQQFYPGNMMAAMFGMPPAPAINAIQQANHMNNKMGLPEKKKKKNLRTAAGQKWEDPTLEEWDTNDYRLFCGDLGNEVTDDTLTRVFTKYTSFQKARVVREKNTNKSKGYGFVSFKDPTDFIRAMREMNGKYVGNRPIKLRKSNWKDRNIDQVRKKIKEKKKLGYKT